MRHESRFQELPAGRRAKCSVQTGRRRERESAAGGRSAGAKAAAGSTIVVRNEVASGHPALCPLRAADLIMPVVRDEQSKALALEFGMDHSAVRRAIDAAVDRGAPLYNAGDASGCYSLYSKVHSHACMSIRTSILVKYLVTEKY